jgi:hypothetical protein
MVRKDFWRSNWFLGVIVAPGGILSSQTDGKLRLDFASTGSNRMLGLASQGQGQLDMAFDKFIHKALGKNKEQRYRTGGERACAIRECATELSVVDVSL